MLGARRHFFLFHAQHTIATPPLRRQFLHHIRCFSKVFQACMWQHPFSSSDGHLSPLAFRNLVAISLVQGRSASESRKVPTSGKAPRCPCWRRKFLLHRPGTARGSSLPERSALLPPFRRFGSRSRSSRAASTAVCSIGSGHEK